MVREESEQESVSRRRFLQRLALITAGGAGVAGAGTILSPPLVAGPTDQDIVPAAYVIWKNGSTYLARNGLTGIDDFSGTDASSVVQSAISNLPSSSPNGGRIHFKPATYPIATEIGIHDGSIVTTPPPTTNNILLTGEIGSVLQATPGIVQSPLGMNRALHSMITISKRSQITLSDLILDTTLAAGLGFNCVSAVDSPASNITVRNCLLTNTSWGIFFGGITNMLIKDNIITNYKFSTIREDAGDYGASSGISILGNILRNNAGATDNVTEFNGYNPASATRSKDLIFAGNIVDGQNVSGGGIDNYGHENVAITGNTFRNIPRNAAIYTHDITINLLVILSQNVNISGNSIKDCPTINGVLVVAEEALVENNTIYNCATANPSPGVSGGILLGSKPGTRSYIVQGNVIKGCGYASADSGSIMIYQKDNLDVRDNLILDAPPNVVGINVWNGSLAVVYNSVRLENNRFLGVTTPFGGGGQNQAGVVKKNNIGYNPLGLLPNPYDNNNSLIGDSGNSSALTSGKTYACATGPIDLYLAGGTASSMTKNGQILCNSLPSAGSAPALVHLEPGDTWSLTFSTLPTTNLVFGL